MEKNLLQIYTVIYPLFTYLQMSPYSRSQKTNIIASQLKQINPFTDEDLNLLDTVPKQVCNFSSPYIFSLGFNTICRRAVRRLIALQPKQNI